MTSMKISRIDLIGQNGNEGEHYKEKHIPVNSNFLKICRYIEEYNREFHLSKSDYKIGNISIVL